MKPRRVVHDTLLDLGVQLRHALVVKGHLSASQDKQHNAKAPDIDLGPGVGFCLQQLRRGEV